MINARIAETTEKIIAPRARPDPPLSAKSQNVFAIIYAPIAQIHNKVDCFSDHSLQKYQQLPQK